MATLDVQLKAIRLHDFVFHDDGTITLGEGDIQKIKAVFYVSNFVQEQALVQT